MRCENRPCFSTASRTVFLHGIAYGMCESCARRFEPPPGSSPLTYLALAVFVVVVGLVCGWALWEWAVSK